MPDEVQSTTMKKETVKPIQITMSFLKTLQLETSVILTEAAQGHNTGIDTATRGATHSNHAPPIEATAIDLAMTHHINHIADHSQIKVLQLINPEIAVDHTHDHPTDLQGRTHTDQVHIPADHEENNTSRRT